MSVDLKLIKNQWLILICQIEKQNYHHSYIGITSGMTEISVLPHF